MPLERIIPIKEGGVFERIDRGIIWVTAIAVILLMTTMVVSILMGVFFRYVLNSALPWPEELARFAMIWVTMLGSGLVMRYGGHIAITFVITQLENWPKVLVILMGRILIIIFLCFLLWFGIDMTRRTSQQWSAALDWSMSIPNLAIPLGAALMLYHMGAAMIRREGPGEPPPKLPFD